MSDANAEQRSRREGSIVEVVKLENRRRKRLLLLIMALFTATIVIGILLLVYGRSDAEVIDMQVTSKVSPVQESYNEIKPKLDQIENVGALFDEVSKVRQDFNQRLEVLNNVSARLDKQDQQLAGLNESQKRLADEVPAVKTRLQEFESVITQVSPLPSSIQSMRSQVEQQGAQLASLQHQQEMSKGLTSSGPLGTLVAGVLLILILGLIVQSIQILIDKLFGLKTRALIKSFEDLLAIITQSHGKHLWPLVHEVINTLKKIGRVDLFGRLSLDSLAKGDLLMAMKQVEAERLIPPAVGNFQNVFGAVRNLTDALRNIDARLLEGDASAKFASLHDSLTPFVHDIDALSTDGHLKPKVLLGELYQLRQIKAPRTLNILGQLQREVKENLATAEVETQSALAEVQKAGHVAEAEVAQTRADAASMRVHALGNVYANLKLIAEQITALSKAFDTAFVPVRNVLQRVEVLYDPIMKGFEERYSRQMKAVSLIVSLVITLWLNLNIFSLYSSNLTFTPIGDAVRRGLTGNGFHILGMILAWIITAALLSIVSSCWHIALTSLRRTQVKTHENSLVVG